MYINNLIHRAGERLINTGKVVKSKHWQGKQLVNPMFQAIKLYLGPAIMPETPEQLGILTQCSRPWAEDHFKERVSHVPSNPGETYKYWPFYNDAKGMRTEGEKFTHTYQERFWPKYANSQDPLMGIRYQYGDLDDLLALLVRDPETRQAYLPIFFPEDTGAIHGGRIPCTLGYLFQIVDGHLHMTYYIRSCDLLRHFRDDVYLAIRLAQYILKFLQNCPNTDYDFSKIRLGTFDMHIGSLHIFNTEVPKVKRLWNL